MKTLLWLVNESFSTRLTLSLLHFLWQGCCVGLVVMIGGSVLSRATARLRYSLNVASMLVMAACLPATFLLMARPDSSNHSPLVSHPVHHTLAPPPTVASSAPVAEPGRPLPSEGMRTDAPVVERQPTSAMGEAATNPGSSRISSTAWIPTFSSLPTASVLPALSRWITALYLAGVTCILGRLVLGVWGGHRLRRLAIVIKDDVLLDSFRKLAHRVGLKVVPAVAWCEQISIPVVVGIVKPIILLPIAVVSNLTPDQLQALMLHELSHIRRFDPIVNLLQRIVEAILFFHPVVWFVSRRISIEREHVADDMVLAAGWDRSRYADALVRVAELAATLSGRVASNRALVLGAAGANPSDFKLRVLRLLDASNPPTLALSRTSILLVLTFVLIGGVFAWSQTSPRGVPDNPADMADVNPTPPPGQQPIPQETEPRQAVAVMPDSLEFLRAYPILQGVSLDMTESQFSEVIERQKLKTRKSDEGDKVQYHVALGDGHTLLVMFDKAGGKCHGIQRVRGDDIAAALQTLRKPALLLPDHWIVMSVGFDNDGKEVVTASTQSFVTIRRWDIVQKKLISEIKLQSDQHGRSFHEGTLTLSGDRKRILAATDAYIGIWETATGKLLTRLPIPKVGDNDTVRLLTCTPDFSVIVGNLATNYSRTTLVYDAYSVVWDGNSGKQLQTLTHKGGTHLIAISLSSDGKKLATTNGSGPTIWDTNTGEQLLHVPNDNAGRTHSNPQTSSLYTNHVWSIQFSPDSKQLAIGDILGVKLIDAESGKLVQQLEGTYSFSSSGSPNLVFARNGQFIARLGTGDKVAGVSTGYVVPIWSTQTGQKRFELHTAANGGAFSEDGRQFAVGFSDMQQALSVWPMNGSADDSERPDGPGPDSRQDKVEENGHYHGKRAAEFIDKFKPAWSDTKLGIQYGIALTKPQRQYRSGERVPLVVFFRNASDQPLKIDMRPDFFGNLPKLAHEKGAAVEFENVPLLGSIPHYVENLEPGEAVGPLYLNFGLGENPRLGEQNWHPYYRAAVVGKYQLTHTVAMEVAGAKDGERAKHGAITSATMEFEIVAGVRPGTEAATESFEEIRRK